MIKIKLGMDENYIARTPQGVIPVIVINIVTAEELIPSWIMLVNEVVKFTILDLFILKVFNNSK